MRDNPWISELTTPVSIALLAILGAVILSSCERENCSGVPLQDVPLNVNLAERTFELGLVPLAAVDLSFTKEKQASAYETASRYAEVLVQRELVDWTAFGDNGSGQSDTVDRLGDSVSRGRRAGVKKVFIELDVAQSRLDVGPLPAGYSGTDFSDGEVRRAFKRMATEVVERFQPDYLGLGVEIDAYYEKHPDDFDNFVSLYKETHGAVKAISPGMQVGTSFQLEQLQGLLASLTTPFSQHEARWNLLGKFDPDLGIAFFTSFPLVATCDPYVMPSDYYKRIARNTDRPIIISEFGWPSDWFFGGGHPHTEAEFLAKFVELTEGLDLRGAYWAYLYDIGFGSPFFDLNPWAKSFGLLNIDGSEKPAFSVWRDLHAVPLVTQGGQ